MSEETVKYDVETQVEEVVAKQKAKRLYRSAIIMFNDMMRVYIVESERSMHLETKSKDSNTWADKNYYTNWMPMLQSIMEKCIKEKIYSKQVKEYKELYALLREIQMDMKNGLKGIEEAIRNNTYLTAITSDKDTTVDVAEEVEEVDEVDE